jgi:hypothetical protein
MKTMIPDEVQFGLDLNDLPARASQIPDETLSLFGRGYCGKGAFRAYDLRANNGTGRKTLRSQYPEAKAYKDCQKACGTVAQTYTSSRSDTGVPGSAYWVCVCCFPPA